MQLFRSVFLLVVLVCAGSAHFALAADTPRVKKPPVDAEQVFAEAAKAEATGRYEEALKLYLRAFTAGRIDPDTRNRIRFCFRLVAQVERHRDPDFQKFVASMPATDAITLYGEVLEQLHKNYADQSRAGIDNLFAAGLEELSAALDTPAFRNEHLKGTSDAAIGEFRELLHESWQAELPTTPREAVKAARSLVSAAVKTLGLRNGAAVVFELLCGACTGLDEYSAYVPPDGFDAQPLHELTAYGLVLRADERGLVVDAVRPLSWAAVNTKLRQGDRILRLNGKSVVGVSAAAVGEAMRASDSLGHRIEFSTTGDLAQGLLLPTPVPSVYGVELLETKEGIGYLRLAAFKDRTPQEFDDAVLELKARGMKALVIDLRGNPGGLFAAAVGIAQRLLPGGPVATTNGQVPEFANRVFTSESGMAAHDFPVVLLVDTKTMSAAEILAASLKDNQRATLVGLPTFGKGLIQGGIRLHSLDGRDTHGGKSGLLIVSVGTASGPLSGLIQGRGVTPHVTEADFDQQLAVAVEKAIDLLTGGPILPPMPMPPLPMPQSLTPIVRR